MRPLRQITFLLEDFALQTPAQQLLDRFLIGYRRDGEFHRSAGVTAVLAGTATTASALCSASVMVVARVRSNATLQRGNARIVLRRAPGASHRRIGRLIDYTWQCT